jgi:hypothetical protein
VSAAARWAPVLGVSAVAAGFSWLNRGERVVIDLGVTTVYRAPLTLVVFVAFLFGMVSMLLLSLRHDLRVRRELERRGIEPSRGPAPWTPPAARRARPAAEAGGATLPGPGPAAAAEPARDPGPGGPGEPADGPPHPADPLAGGPRDA